MFGRKIISFRQAIEISKKLREKAKKVILAHGCFDLLHLGHIFLFEYGKKKGEILMVGVLDDRQIRYFKGKNRPITAIKERMTMISALESVDYVFPVNYNGKMNLKNIYRFYANLYKKLLPKTVISGNEKGFSEVKRKQCLETGINYRSVRHPWLKTRSSKLIEQVTGQTGKNYPYLLTQKKAFVNLLK
jgi:cytidyltransferase-like protein